MSINPTVYGELTQAYRYADNIDNAVLADFPLARNIESQTFFSEMVAVQLVADERTAMLGVPRRRFLVTVQGTTFVRPFDFLGTCPAVMLKCAKWGLSAGRRMLIIKFEIDYAANETRLTLWG